MESVYTDELQGDTMFVSPIGEPIPVPSLTAKYSEETTIDVLKKDRDKAYKKKEKEMEKKITDAKKRDQRRDRLEKQERLSQKKDTVQSYCIYLQASKSMDAHIKLLKGELKKCKTTNLKNKKILLGMDRKHPKYKSLAKKLIEAELRGDLDKPYISIGKMKSGIGQPINFKGSSSSKGKVETKSNDKVEDTKIVEDNSSMASSSSSA